MPVFDQSDYFKLSGFPNCADWLLSMVPKCCLCRCCKRSRRQVGL